MVIPKRTHPAGTGWVDRLYELRGLSGANAQAIEETFMKPVDTAAANVLKAFSSEQRVSFSADEMEAWARFMLSLMHRHPDDLRAFKAHFAHDWRNVSPEMDQDYQRRRRREWPEDLQAYMNGIPDDQAERIGLTILVELMENLNVIRHVISMRWGALCFPTISREVITSDRPLIMTDGLGHAESFILMPIGPRKVFYAVNTPEMVRRFNLQDPNRTIESINKQVARQASRYVYAGSDGHLGFVSRWMSETPTVPLVDQIKAGRVQRALARSAR